MYAAQSFQPAAIHSLASEIAKKTSWRIIDIKPDQLVLKTDNGRYVHNAEISIAIEDGNVYLKSTSVGNEMFDMGRNRKNIALFQENYYEMYRAFPLEVLSEKFEQLQPEEPTPAENDLPAEAIKSLYSVDFIALFKPTRNYVVTPVIIYINIAIFIIMVACGADIFEPNADTLLQWGGNLRKNTLSGEWWRLISCCFLHFGLMHLLMNMFALAYIGNLLEPKLGKLRYLSAYLLTGIFASAVSFWEHSLTVSAGASGAIFGMYGIFLALLTSNFIEKRVRNIVLPSILVFIIYSLLSGIHGNVDNAAHVGGLISGIIMGYIFIPGLVRANLPLLKYGSVAIMALFAFLTTVVFANTVSTQSDLDLYNQKISDFIEMESMAKEVYGHIDYYPREEAMAEINSRSTYYWKENLLLVDEIDDLDLPDEFYKRNDLAREYCTLHIQMNDLLYKALNEQTTQYVSKIQEYDFKIKEILKKLNETSR